MRGHAWALAPVAALSILAAPAAAADRPIKTVALRYAFAGQTHGVPRNHLDITGEANIAPGAFIAEALLDLTKRDHPVVRIASLFDLDQLEATRAYGPLGATDVCPGAPVCVIGNGRLLFSAGYSPTEAHGSAYLRYYLIVRAANVHYRVRHLDGWHPTPYSGAVERVTDAQSTGAGVEAANVDTGLMTGVASDRTTTASVAVADPPCDDLGAGSLTLTGARQPITVPCGGDPTGAVAYVPTVWRLTGVAAGASHNATRLLVFTL